MASDQSAASDQQVNDRTEPSDHEAPGRSDETGVGRREFLSGLAAASAFTIVPRSVLGGPGYIPPSDRLNVAQIGCGTQAIRKIIPEMITRDDIQYTCVCDPNRSSTNYVDWGRMNLINNVRKLLDDDTWGADFDGIPGGREVARNVIERYYEEHRAASSSDGIRAYEDFRELFQQENDLDAAVIITPDHTHGTLATAAMEHDVAAIMHKPIANRLNEVQAAVEKAREPSSFTHLLAWSDEPDYHRLEAWLDAGVIGTVHEVHNWTQRPVWPQGWGAVPENAGDVSVPDGFNWSLWLGPEQDRPYHPNYTFALYRGWFDFGTGTLGDMGNYSLFQPYRMLNLGSPIEAEGRPNSLARLNPDNTCSLYHSEVAYPHAGQMRFKHQGRDNGQPVNVYWYSGGILPEKPDEMIREGADFAREGMMFVGSDGIILCNFHGDNPRLIPSSRMRYFDEEAIEPQNITTTADHDEWTNALKEGRRSRGAFENYSSLAEVTALTGVVMRFPQQTLRWNSDKLEITNVTSANDFVTRNYRSGWEV